LLGLILFVVAFPLLFWNEGRAVTTYKTLTDPVFEVSAKALKLRRTAEMYQCKESSSSETTKKLGGGTETVTEYSYSKTWSEQSINSDNFKKSYEHPNPPSMPYTSTEQTADRVTLDAFTLSPALVRSIDSFEPLVLGSDTALPGAIKETGQLYDAGYFTAR